MDQPLPPLIRALLEPDAWPAPATEVTLVETHISWVFLAGDFAYKVKKPVDFGFVDFSTPERRKAFCEEELRLNARLAPALYLDVLPISGTPEAPCPGGQGPAIEHAVRMRRFRREDEFGRLADRGELTADQVEALARRVADFHARADRRPADPRWGSPQQVLEHWLANFEVIRRSGIAQAHSARLDALERWTRSEHARLAALMAARHAQGFVRECHGDLHLGNIVLLDGEPVPFDALEFDPGLRWTDVVAEIAFTMMDLHAHDRSGLARRFLDAWLERTGDFAGLALLPAMLAYRAMVRAKVCALQVAQAADGPGRRAGMDRLDAWIALAARLSLPRPLALVIASGVSGSGKSRLARALVEASDFIRVRSDVERKRLAGLRAGTSAEAPPGAGLYQPARTEAVYARLASLATTVLDAGYPVLVDATFLRRSQRDAFRARAAAAGVRFRTLAVEAPEAVLRERVAARRLAGTDPSDATLDVLESQLASREPLGEDERADSVVIDTTAAVDAAALAVRLLQDGTQRQPEAPPPPPSS